MVEEPFLSFSLSVQVLTTSVQVETHTFKPHSQFKSFLGFHFNSSYSFRTRLPLLLVTQLELSRHHLIPIDLEKEIVSSPYLIRSLFIPLLHDCIKNSVLGSSSRLSQPS